MAVPPSVAHDELTAQLALLRLPNASPRELTRIYQTYESLSDLFRAPNAYLKTQDRGRALEQYLKSPAWDEVEQDLRWADTRDQYLIPLHSEKYPDLLRQINTPPLVLYVKGELQYLNAPKIAIVGARKPSADGMEAARWFSRYLAEAGLSIVSGLAYGIDGLAHHAALSVLGSTLAVLGSGLNHIYPREHLRLAQQLTEHGALISEFPLETKPQARYFPWRNRIVSGLCRGIILIEAAFKSGTLITARLAIEQNRELFVVPGSIFQAQSAGSHALIREGAELVSHPSQVLQMLA